jgi:hypothetical protein
MSENPLPSAERDVPQFPVPEGWLPFGSLIDYDGPAECSDETGEDGLPLWERPIPPADGADRAGGEQ